MTNRELLELAAKAAGIDGEWCEFTLHPSGEVVYGIGNSMVFTPGVTRLWNPLEDDGDALRLAVKLGLRISTANGSGDRKMTEVLNGYGMGAVVHGKAELHGDDPMAATRRAIVRAAAEIGKDMP